MILESYWTYWQHYNQFCQECDNQYNTSSNFFIRLYKHFFNPNAEYFENTTNKKYVNEVNYIST